MWQRIQTLFLIAVVVSLVFMIFFPVWEAKAETTRLTLYPLYYRVQLGDSISEIYFPYSLIAILSLAGATVASIAIQKFKNRLLQIKLGALNSLFIAASLVVGVYLATKLARENHAPGNFGLALYLPFVALICNTIANRFIRRDEKLVKDSDRLR